MRLFRSGTNPKEGFFLKGKRLLCGISVLLLLSLLVSACAPASESTSSAASSASSTASASSSEAAASSESSASETVSTKADKNTLIYAVASEPGKIDPQENAVITGITMEKQLYDPLIQKDPETGEFLPCLATAWEWVDDTHLAVTLREGVTFHDGSPMTAEDVQYTISRFETGAATGSLYAAFDAENTVVEDDTHLTIAFKYPYAPALNFLTNSRAFIVSKAYCEANGPEALNQNAMGTGAFKFVEWTIGAQATMVRNDDYWGEVPAFENLIFKFVVDNTARMVALETGEVDIVSEIAAEDVNRAVAGEIEHVIGYATPSYKVNFLNFNYQVPELAIKENRLAIAHAVDWEAACEAAGAGVIQPARSCLASTVFAYQPQGIYDYDPELAKEYLAEAGNPDGFAVKATIGETATTMRMMEIIQANLADVGIALEIEIVDTPTLNEANNKGLSELTVGNMTANTADPAHTLNGTDQNSPRMSFRVTDARYNELMEEGLREMDETKRAAIYEELQQYVYENAIQIPMFEEIITYAVRDYVVGFVPDGGLQIDFKTLSIA